MKLDVAYVELGTIDTALTDALKACIAAADWEHDDYRKSMVEHLGQYDSIMLRHSPEYDNATVRDMPLMPGYLAALDPILDRLAELYNVDNYVAFLANVKPGGYVVMHIDTGDFLEKIHRVHIPIETNPQCAYVFEASAVNMQVGKMYEIDNLQHHGVVNKGQTDRIHLVVNIYGARRA